MGTGGQAVPLERKFQLYQQSRHVRHQDHLPCILCGDSITHGLESYTEHFTSVHADVLERELAASTSDTRASIARKYYRRSQNPPTQQKQYAANNDSPDQPSPAGEPKPTTDTPAAPATPSLSKASAQPNRGSPVASSHSQTRRSRVRQTASTPDPDFTRPKPQNPVLWSANNPGQGTSGKNQNPAARTQHEDSENKTDTMQRQPDTRPITQQQLVAEVKGIYTGLVMVESKCIEVDTAQADESAKELSHEQYQALIALHRALLHEHHDFFLASQHPSASDALKRLALKYSMPARMWRHAIHSFLELLRKRLPGSLQHMLSYIYLAYSMMGLLYETVPAYKETWIECLGDLGRYRMAIEDESVHDRETWTAVSRYWYSKASDLSPTTGRLYHHLAILARPNWLRQLFYYSKSLCVPNPFLSTRESILTLFDPVLSDSASPLRDLQEPIDDAFVQAHACMFLGQHPERWRTTTNKFLELLDNHIARTAKLYMEPAYYMGIANSCALVEYGSKTGLLYNIINPLPSEKQQAQPEEIVQVKNEDQDSTMKGVEEEQQEQPTQELSTEFLQARELFCKTARAVFQRLGDPNVWPFVHVTMVFVHHLTFIPSGIELIERDFPWRPFVDLLNTLKTDSTRYEDEKFPGLHDDAEPPRPLPEDFAMRGLLWTDKYHSEEWFGKAQVDDEDKYFEVASMAEQRKERILWLGCRIAVLHNKWIIYKKKEKVFSVAAEFDDVRGEAGDEDIEIDDAVEAEAETPTNRHTAVDLQDLDLGEVGLEMESREQLLEQLRIQRNAQLQLPTEIHNKSQVDVEVGDAVEVKAEEDGRNLDLRRLSRLGEDGLVERGGRE